MNVKHCEAHVGPGDHLVIASNGHYCLRSADGSTQQVGDPRPTFDHWYMSPAVPVALALAGLVLALLAVVIAVGAMA